MDYFGDFARVDNDDKHMRHNVNSAVPEQSRDIGIIGQDNQAVLIVNIVIELIGLRL